MEFSTLNAVGVWFYCTQTDRYLYLMRRDVKHPNTWGLPGGKVNDRETLLAAMERECQEEIGGMPKYTKIVPLEKFTSADNKFNYHTFFCTVEEEFCPILNDEHKGYAWIDSSAWPKPMHPGLWNTINLEEILQKLEVAKKKY